MSTAFYVYEHTRRDTGAVFYVGKGKGDRAWQKGAARRNNYWKNIVHKHGHDVRMVCTGLDEELALLCEIELIDKYKRLGITLANVTDGGEGVCVSGDHLARRNAAIRRGLSTPVAKARLSAGVRAARSTPEMKARISAKSFETNARPDVKARISASIRAAKATPAAKAQQSSTAKEQWAKRLKPVLCVETGVVFPRAIMAVEWLQAVGWPKASGGSISSVCSGKRPQCYGYTWRFA